MSQRRTLSFLAATILLAFASFDSAAQAGEPAPPPVRQIDHIMVRTEDPGKLYAFFTETLRLPAAWPLFRNTRRRQERRRRVRQRERRSDSIPRTETVTGAIDRVWIRAVPASGIPCRIRPARCQMRRTAALVATGKDGSKNTLWTNFTLRQFSDAEAAGATMHSSSANTVPPTSMSSSVVRVCAGSWGRAAAGHSV